MALLHCNFHSQELQIAASMDVILPQERCLHQGNVPVLYLLHGLSDDHTMWQRRTSIERYVEPFGLAVVMPAVERSYYADMVDGPRYWTFISQEVPAVAQAFLPISAERRDSFVAGLSMGGYGACKLALRFPDRFAAAASLSGAVDVVARMRAAQGPTRDEYRRRFGSVEALAGSDDDLFHLAEEAVHTTQRPSLYQCCGTSDELHQDNVRFRDHVRSLGLDLTYEEGPGGHEWEYWDRQIQRVLRWLPLKELRR